ncbi:MAG TPA: thioesterase family protein [Albitalea sp.]|uniref:thioesterase family protein n=1 Tax=Piscinibacter sp. TaxID=1903157 RepID=UPI002ED12B88
MEDHACEVRAEWVDYNGHLRDACYALIFSHAIDGLMDEIGLDAAGRARHGSSLYTVETHIRYLHEVRGGERVRVQTRVVSHDAKRLRVAQAMFGQHSVEPVATAEQVLLHVSMEGAKVVPFPEAVRKALGVTVDDPGLHPGYEA